MQTLSRVLHLLSLGEDTGAVVKQIRLGFFPLVFSIFLSSSVDAKKDHYRPEVEQTKKLSFPINQIKQGKKWVQLPTVGAEELSAELRKKYENQGFEARVYKLHNSQGSSGSATYAIHPNGLVVGLIKNYSTNEFYEVYQRPGEAKATLLAVNPDEFDPCVAKNGTRDDYEHHRPTEAIPTTASPTSSSVQDNTQVTIDVAILYTSTLRQIYGSDFLETKIQLAMIDANLALSNSELGNVSLNPIHIGEIEFNEPGGVNLSTFLNYFRNSGDGEMEEAQQIREQYGADLMALITKRGSGACGTARGASYNLNDFEAYSVTKYGCMSGGTFTHELGHTLGLDHNREDAAAHFIDSDAYNFGYYFQDGSFSTIGSIMSYEGSRRDYFSNPEVLYNGHAFGVFHDDDPENSANNARMVRLNALAIAGYRDRPGEMPSPQAVSEVEGSLGSFPNGIFVEWEPVAGAHYYRIYRGRRSGVEASRLYAETTSNSFADLNIELGENEFYYYQVQAVNNSGGSIFHSYHSSTFGYGLPGEAEPADIDGDGDVDGQDLAALLTAWGQSGRTDLDQDGTTGSSDLSILLASWT